MGGPPTVDERLRLALISLHASPTAALGRGGNGGLNVYVREVCRQLSRRGVATDVFTRRGAGDGPAEEVLAPLSRVVYLPAVPEGLDKYQLLDHVPALAAEVERYISRSDCTYDLLYSHYWLSGVAACLLRGRLGVPWAHTAHTLAVVKNRQLAPDDRPEPEIRADLEGEIGRCADLLVVSTAGEGDALCRAYGISPARVAVVAPGVDLEMFRPQPREAARSAAGFAGQRLFLFVGRLERLKGVETLLRAFARLTADGCHPEARLLVVGEDGGDGAGEKQRLQALAALLGLSGQVGFAGSVSHERLAGYYAAADACLLPSYSESFGLVGLEAQACGTPVIASAGAGLASIVRDGVTGFLVEGHEPAEYADRMARLLADSQLTEAMGRRARRLAERFSWERTASGLLSHFSGVAGQAGVQAIPRTEYG